jgi:glucose-1-phosphate adenylyltransferase
MKSTMGIILNNPSIDLGALTEIRSVITLPFASRYRLVDFPLSNMVNSKIGRIGVFASNKYRSLVDHIGTGQEWSLARKSQDLIILQGGIPNYMGGRPNRINLADFYDNFGLFNRNDFSNLVISGSNMVCNIDLVPVLEQHEQTDADVTMVSKRVVSSLDRCANDVGIQAGDGTRVISLSDNNTQGYDRV